MTHAAFFYPAFESLGVEYLSSYLKSNGHTTSLYFDPQVFEDDYTVFGKGLLNINPAGIQHKLITKLLDSKPDIVGFSVVTDQYRWALKLAQAVKLRNPDIPIIFGGIHPTSVPDMVIAQDCVDIVCVGEGEDPLKELMDNFEEYKKKRQLNIKNLIFKREGAILKNEVRDLISDLNVLPFPDRGLFYDQVPEFYLQYNLLSGRGCAFRCSYCCNNTLSRLYAGKGKYLRQRSVDNVMSELNDAKEKYKFPLLYIRDEVFGYNIGWLKEFSKRYSAEIKIPFKCFIEPSLVKEEVVSELKKAGCIFVSMGIQSVNENLRKNVLFRPETNVQVAYAMRLFREAGIKINVDHIAGIPGETEKEMREAAEFYAVNRPNIITYFWLTLYPKTDMVNIFKEKGLANDEEIRNVEEGLGASNFMGGNVKENRQIFRWFRTFLNYIPLFPAPLTRLILKYRLYRYFNLKSIFFSSLLPRLLLAPFNHEIPAWRAESGFIIGKIKYARKLLKS